MTRFVCKRVVNVNGLTLAKDPHRGRGGRRPDIHLNICTETTDVTIEEHTFDDPEGNGLKFSGLYNLFLDDEHMVRAEEIVAQPMPDDG